MIREDRKEVVDGACAAWRHLNVKVGWGNFISTNSFMASCFMCTKYLLRAHFVR